MAINADEIARMSREEKLRIMEMVWADLSRDEADVESPAWHEAVLRETDERVVAGSEGSVDWDEAKHELRKRFD